MIETIKEKMFNWTYRGGKHLKLGLSFLNHAIKFYTLIKQNPFMSG